MAEKTYFSKNIVCLINAEESSVKIGIFEIQNRATVTQLFIDFLCQFSEKNLSN